MKEYNKYLIIAFLVIFIVTFLVYYFMNLKEEAFTYGEEQIITAQLLAANGGFIPQMSGNQDEESQYKYMNSNGINVNAMPLPVQQLTNPLCFNDVLSSNGKKLLSDKFEKDKTVALEQLIKANDQLIDANEQLLRASGKGDYSKQKKEHENRNNNAAKGAVASVTSPVPSNNGGTSNTASYPVPNNGETSNTTSSPVPNNGGTSNTASYPVPNNGRSPTYSSIYEEQVVRSPYTKCVTKGYSSDYCNNMYGTQYATPVQSQPATPVQSQPATPVQSQPATPVQSQPATPVQSQPATPVPSSTNVTMNLPSYDSIAQNGLYASGVSTYGAREVFHRTPHQQTDGGYDASTYDK